jgi:hypothetical protein
VLVRVGVAVAVAVGVRVGAAVGPFIAIWVAVALAGIGVGSPGGGKNTSHAAVSAITATAAKTTTIIFERIRALQSLKRRRISLFQITVKKL